MNEPANAPGQTTSGRDRVAGILMLVAAVAALFAFITGIGIATGSGPATQQVQWWRELGYLMFAGIFVLLAFWPRRYPGLWELVILDKAVLTVVEAVLVQNDATDAATTAASDGILTVVLIAAYLLSRGYRSWWHPR
jgi:uncharacterized membrane protein